MAFLQTLPQRKPISQIDNYVHFYKMGDGGGAFLLDSGSGATDLTTTIPPPTQSTDAVQGEVANFGSNDAGFIIPWVTGDVDKSFTVLINASTISNTKLLHNSVNFSIIEITNATNIGMFNGTDTQPFVVPTVVVDTWFELGMSITSDFKYRLYYNGIESITGEFQGTATLNLDRFSDYFATYYIGFGGKLRIYDKALSALDFASISKRDLKVA